MSFATFIIVNEFRLDYEDNSKLHGESNSIDAETAALRSGLR